VYYIKDDKPWSADQLTQLYLKPSLITNMKSQKISNWDKMVHAPFKKVVKFDLICMSMGVVMGIGIGAYLVASGILR